MNTYKTNATGWSAHEELLKALRELGFKSGMPNIPRGSHTGSFWLFGEDVKRLKKMSDKNLQTCIESANRKFFITGKSNHESLYCVFSVVSK